MTQAFNDTDFDHGFEIRAETIREESAQHTRRDAKTVRLEARIADKYQSLTDNPVSDSNIGAALAILGAAFYTPGTNADDEGNLYNDTAFQQRGALGNVCQNGKWMLENAEQHLTDLYTKLDQQEATFDDTEIAIRNLNITLDKIERCKTAQIPTCREYLRIAQAAYRAIIGEEWTPYVKGKDRKAQTKEALQERLKAARAR